jgi:hypothetical protein
MELELYCQTPADEAVNAGFDSLKVWALLNRLKETRDIDFKIIDTSLLSDDELMSAYEKRAIPASFYGFRIRKIFGSNRSPGWRFGKSVPALIVIEDETPVAIYPSEREGTGLVTIRDYLDSLGATALSPSDLAAQMDEARRELGPIGIRTSDLVHEGRRR